MTPSKLYLIHGLGSDSIGLVEKITSPISKIKGNIVDLRQDVMHGLFIIDLVADLAASEITLDDFKKLVEKISDDTGLTLFLDSYRPIPRDPGKENILLILLGYDAPGIIAAVTEVLRRYSINIEFSQMVAREGVFLMELLVDICRSTIPVENLKSTLKETMGKMNIATMFQLKDVFNKKKRIIVFNYSQTMMKATDRTEILQLCGIEERELAEIYPKGKPEVCMKNAAKFLEGLPEDVIRSIIRATAVTSSTIELLQTLKTMGYRIVLASNAFDIFIEHLKDTFGLEYAFGCPLVVNDDGKCFTGEIETDFFLPGRKEALIREIMEKENVVGDDVTTISDERKIGNEKPGVGMSVGIKTILDCYNQHIISRENLLGIMGIFGPLY